MFKRSLAAFGLTLFATTAAAQTGLGYEVTITNLTPGQTFTPQLIVTHSRDYRMFTPGQPASEALEILAEGGATGPFEAGVTVWDPVTGEPLGTIRVP